MDFYTNVARLGNNILLRAVENGVEVQRKIPYEPTLFIRSNKKDTGWKTLKGIPVEPRLFDSMRDANDFVKQFEDSDIDMVHSVVDYPINYIHEAYPKQIAFDMSLIRIFYLDIECDTTVIDGVFPKPEEALAPINAITVYDSIKKKYFIFSYLLEKFEDETLPNSVYVRCDNERDLLFKFLAFWQRDYPAIITGWNSTAFDMPYIINRVSNVMGEESAARLSPWGKIMARSHKNDYGQEVVTYSIFGIEMLDFLDLYKKYVPKSQESFKLGYIASLELDDTKIEYEGSLDNLAETDPYMFLRYNAKDVSLIVRMEAKMQLLYLACTVAYLMRVNYQDVLGTVKPWTSRVVFALGEKNIVVDKHHRTQASEYGGGYVKEPLTGKYGWVVSYDFTSLYPHILMSWNISPETKLQYNEIPEDLIKYYRRDLVDAFANGEFTDTDLLVKHDLALTSNGMFYRRDKEGIIPVLVKEVFQGRKAKKKEMLTHKQLLVDIEAEIHRRENVAA